MRPDPNARRGFILATTLLVMTLLTVMLTAAFIMISSESRATSGSYSLGRALNLAQSGLHSYFASAHALGTGYDSTNYAFPGGYARVVARRLRDSTAATLPLWIVYSTGVDSTRTLTPLGGGSRTVASFAYQPGQLPARAAMVAANGINVTAGGATNPLNGNNASIGDAWVVGCTEPALDDTTAVTTDSGGYSQSAGASPTGTVQVLASDAAVTDSTRIDWTRVVAGDLYPDYTGTLPADCYGNSTACPYNSFYYPGDVTIPASGFGTSRRGLLVVTGNVTLANGAHWDGIIIAGGKVTAIVNTYTVHGMVISGMNCATSSCPAQNLLRRGGTIRWDWCYTHAAISGFASLAPVSGTFMDTWKTY